MLTGPEIGEAFNVINKATGYATPEELFATITDGEKSERPSFTQRFGKTLMTWPNIFRMSREDTLKLSHKVLEAMLHELKVDFVKTNPAAFGGTQVIAAPSDKKEATAKVDAPKLLTKAEFEALNYKAQKAYLKEHPELAEALAA
jgi:hypothetical protein